MVKYVGEDHIDQVFSALAHPVRRAILEHLKRSNASVSTLAAPYEISLPAITKHLKVLERAGLIERQREGQTHLIKLHAARMKEASVWIDRYRVFWESQLDNLEKYLFEEDLEAI